MAIDLPPHRAYAQGEDYELQKPRTTIELDSLKSRKRSRGGGLASLFRCCMGLSDGAFKAYNMCLLTFYAVIMIGAVVMLLLAWHWASEAYNHIKGDVMGVINDVKENVGKVKEGIQSVESLLGKAGDVAESAVSGAAAAITSKAGEIKSLGGSLKSHVHIPKNDHPRTTLFTACTMVNASHPHPTGVRPIGVPSYLTNAYNEAYNSIRTAGKTLCDQSQALTSAGFNLDFQNLYSMTTGFCDFVVSGQFPLPPISEMESKACRLYLDLQGIGVAYCSRSTEVVVENEDESDAMFQGLVGIRSPFCDATSGYGVNVPSAMAWGGGDCEGGRFM
ncbi:uncharacterized protein BDZ99DRAFT_466492 [Mytilinidion resinicola]|uniref:Uncharacterized protein n=1 Tax=Mytilinidion resinicola TaxID=574789 RepID=A0A6A6Y9L0_9PEZI|nr:uncharacterized protein BDZ99DRAFT_466492 [Mytilinidion resinicola]KAF2805501.1 hypothetical protein BDZ99DRAFT_466492 [Mytilinidion resinicola]